MPDVTYLSVSEIAKQLNISEDTVRRWIKAGKLPALELGGQYRIHPQEYEAFLQRHKKRLPD
jgi:excisionase family DNA binding protein